VKDLKLRFNSDTSATITAPAKDQPCLVTVEEGSEIATLTLEQFDQLVSFRDFLAQQSKAGVGVVAKAVTDIVEEATRPKEKSIGLSDLWDAMKILAHFKTHEISVSKKTWCQIKRSEKEYGTDEELLANAKPFIRNGVTISLATAGLGSVLV
jgi:hypothetical protein